MNITKEMEDILFKNRIFRPYEQKGRELKKYFKLLGSRLPPEDQAVIVCGAEAADRIMTEAGIRDRTKAVMEPGNPGFRVNSWRRRIYGIDIVTFNEAEKYGGCVFVVADDRDYKPLLNDLYFYGKQIINVSDEIRLLSPELYAAFKDWMVTYNTPFERIMLLRRKYEIERSGPAKKNYLEELIYSFLKIKDIKSALKYIHAYIDGGYDGDGCMLAFKGELETLTDCIKRELKKRDKYHDIIMIWNDGLRYDELKEMAFLGGGFSDSSLCFENAFSTVYDSEGSLGSMFQKKYQVDDYHVHEGESYSSENSPVIQFIENKGYKFRNIFHFYLADEKHTDLIGPFAAGSEKLWMCIEYLLGSNEPVFFMLQENAETHNPYHSPYIDKDYYFIDDCTPEQYQEQIRISRTYWDEQLEFYLNLMNYDNIKILMSDHGKPMTLHDLCVLDWGYLSDYLHIVFMVNGRNITARKMNRIFSGYNFLELLEYALDPSEENIEKCFPEEYVKIQSVDRYNPEDIARKLKAGTDKRHLMSYRGVRTLEDMYIEAANGEEMYFRLPDERTNQINSPLYKKRIRQLKDLNRGKFLDIKNIPFFEASLKLYD